MLHIWKNIPVQSSCHQGLAEGKSGMKWISPCCLTASSDRSWLATPAPWREQWVKTADIIPQEAGKHYCNVETWSTKICFDPTEAIRRLCLCVCLGWGWVGGTNLKSRRDKMLMIQKPFFWWSGFVTWLLGFAKKKIKQFQDHSLCKTCVKIWT